MPNKSRYLQAFKESGNAIGLATSVALSAAFLSPFPLLAGLVAEAAYLLFIPDSKWYEARLAKKFDAEILERRQKLKEEVFPTLSDEMRTRFENLEATRKQIDAQAQDDKAWFREVLRKLDYLLEKFLLFAGKEAQFRSYLRHLRDEVRGEPPGSEERNERQSRSKRSNRDSDEIPRRVLIPIETGETRPVPADRNDRWIQQTVEEVQMHYERERQNIEQTLQAEPDYDTQIVLKKRVDVLNRRDEFAGKIGKILANMNHQLQLVEDTFGLINDEIRARSPEQIIADIDEVVVATNSMSSALEELSSIEQMAARLSA